MYSLFVCLLLSTLFCFPSFLPSLFFVTDFVSVLPSGTNSYSLFLARKKMMIIIVEEVVVVGFNCV